MRYRALSPWTIAAWAALIVLVGVGVAVWLLLAYTGGDADATVRNWTLSVPRAPSRLTPAAPPHCYSPSVGNAPLRSP